MLSIIQLVSEPGLTSFTRITNSIGNFKLWVQFERLNFITL
uniref:Uncharacterized protein n=1 Tax=Arundo donax TaxID=35708 RepID=A0A0A9D6Y9_ARUDO